MVMMPFVAYLSCSIDYKGRASATLPLGNYLIIHKLDGSIAIHGATKITPRNYLGSKAKVEFIDPNIIKAHRNKETIIITVTKAHFLQAIPDWSDTETIVTRTEADLVAKFLVDPQIYLGFKSDAIHTEYITPVGNIDVLIINQIGYHVLEFKRKSITVNDCTQVLKYIEAIDDCFGGSNRVYGYLVGPTINSKAVKYAERHAITWLKLDFDDD